MNGSLHRIIMNFLGVITNDKTGVYAKGQGQRSNVKVTEVKTELNRFWPNLGVSGLYLQLEFTDGYEMMHKAWSNIYEVSYYFSRSYVKFQGQ